MIQDKRRARHSYRHKSVNLAGIPRAAETVPDCLVGGEEWVPQGRLWGGGQAPSPEKNEFSLEMACFGEF